MRDPSSKAQGVVWSAGGLAQAHRPKSPASPKVPLPANSPVLKDLRSSGQSSQRQPGNWSCHSWHFSVQYSSTHMVHMCDLHMIVSNRAWPLQGTNSAEDVASTNKNAIATALIGPRGVGRTR